MTSRPNVGLDEGEERQSLLGATLNCVECDRVLTRPPAAGPRETRAPEKR
jgi:hypothetical protein